MDGTKQSRAKEFKGATWGSNVELKDTGKSILEYLSSKDADRDFRVLGEFRKVNVTDASQLTLRLKKAPRRTARGRVVCLQWNA